MVGSHQEKITFYFIIDGVLCEKLEEKTLPRNCWLSNFQYMWFLNEKKKHELRRMPMKIYFKNHVRYLGYLLFLNFQSS